MVEIEDYTFAQTSVLIKISEHTGNFHRGQQLRIWWFVIGSLSATTIK